MTLPRYGREDAAWTREIERQRKLAKKEHLKTLAAWWACFAVVYLLVSVGVYAIRNPELTQTQVWLNVWEALRWQ